MVNYKNDQGLNGCFKRNFYKKKSSQKYNLMTYPFLSCISSTQCQLLSSTSDFFFTLTHVHIIILFCIVYFSILHKIYWLLITQDEGSFLYVLHPRHTLPHSKPSHMVISQQYLHQHDYLNNIYPKSIVCWNGISFLGINNCLNLPQRISLQPLWQTGKFLTIGLHIHFPLKIFLSELSALLPLEFGLLPSR